MRSNCLLLTAWLTLFLFGCDPTVTGRCYSNEECVAGYLCDYYNRCVSVEQKQLDILIEKLDAALVGSKYSFELSVYGGLPPYIWEIKAGPDWLEVENENSIWRLTGVPLYYQKDAVLVEMEVTDSSIREGQSTDKNDLSIRSLYCLLGENLVCSGNGTCIVGGLCDCDDAHTGSTCGVCNEAGGYELNADQLCVRYEYRCELVGVCGADVLKCECIGQECEAIEDCESVLDCVDTSVCSINGDEYTCDDCQGTGCTGGACNGCTDGACCSDGKIQSNIFECKNWIQYKCGGPSCGAERLKGIFTQYCDGSTTGCAGDINDKWEVLDPCGVAEGCAVPDVTEPPQCTQCEHGCSEDGCITNCGPYTHGCCTEQGTFIDACWYDADTEFGWQNPSYGEKTWMDAKSVCSEMVVGGRDDWRLPTITELRSLIKDCWVTQVLPYNPGSCRVLDSCSYLDCWDASDCGGCNYLHGPHGDGYYTDSSVVMNYPIFWSASPVLDLSGNAWYVSFTQGGVFRTSATTQYAVRCVRGKGILD